MRIAVVGLDFPLGKKSLVTQRWNKLQEIFHTQKSTPIQLEFVDSAQSKVSDGLLCEQRVKLDLIIQDLDTIENQLNSALDKEVMLKCKEALEKEIVLNEVPFSEEEKKLLSNLNLLTLKPITFVDKENLAPILEIMQTVFTNCGMISFFTANERELRAWAVKKGISVFEAAGFIHSDLQRGFIKAEVISYEDLTKSGGLNQARGKGLMRVEGKTYIVKDGDSIQIRFNV